ncbi:MAG: hypothetical protein K0Q87_1146 [Neobacillus sp.]|nr:hypothetical protein [Neobacillus sp.]
MRKWWSPFKKVWKFIVLLFLILLTFSYGMFQGGFVSWFLFYSFLPFALYSFAFSFYPLKGIEVSRHIEKFNYNAGEPLRVKVTVKRRSFFPLFYLIIADQLDDNLINAQQKERAKVLILPGFKKEISFDYVIDKLPRGEHLFKGFTLKAGDLFGLIEKEISYPIENKLIVYPFFTDLLYRPFENPFDQGMTASRERVQRDTSMAVGIRDYQPGDRFSWINWKATAKRNEVMTKEFEQRQSHDVFIVMDCVPDKHFEAIVSFTASMQRAVLKKGASTGLLTVSEERSFFPLGGGEKQQQLLLFHLAKVKAKGSSSFDKVIETEGMFVQQTVSFLLVTGQLTKRLIEKASFLGQRKGKITLFVIKGERESPTSAELSLITMANARGVRVIMVHEGNFAAAFSEVNF